MNRKMIRFMITVLLIIGAIVTLAAFAEKVHKLQQSVDEANEFSRSAITLQNLEDFYAMKERHHHHPQQQQQPAPSSSSSSPFRTLPTTSMSSLPSFFIPKKF